MISKWSTYLVKRYLHKFEKRHGKRELVPFKKVSRVGIVYKVGDPNDEKFRKYIEQQLEASGKRVMTLGFIDKKEIDPKYQPNIHHDYFSRKDLSRFKLPKRTRVMRFVTESFDYMIYCSEDVSVPLLGVTALSRAKCRIGPFFKELAFGFDLLIKKGSEEIDYSEQIISYLKNYKNG